MSVSVNVQYVGPGGTNNYHVELIRRSLELIGYEVTVTNNYNLPDPWIADGTTRDEWFKKAGDHWAKFEAEYGKWQTQKASIHVTNIPWGG